MGTKFFWKGPNFFEIVQNFFEIVQNFFEIVLIFFENTVWKKISFQKESIFGKSYLQFAQIAPRNSLRLQGRIELQKSLQIKMISSKLILVFIVSFQPLLHKSVSLFRLKSKQFLIAHRGKSTFLLKVKCSEEK